MTKVTVFGEQKSKAEKKPIEFVWYISSVGERSTACHSSEWDNICMLGNNGDYDIFLVWDDGEAEKSIYLGRWNDGVVE